MNKTKGIVLGFLFAAVCLPLFAQTPVTELNFYKKQSQGEDKKLLAVLVGDITAWVDSNSAAKDSDDALLLRADIQNRIKQYPAAYITLLRHKYEFTASANTGTVKELTGVVIGKLRSKEQQDATDAAAVVVTGAKTEDRLAAFLAAATKLNLKDTYEPLEREYRAFFARFPQYENRDKLELMFGDLYRQNNNYQAAVKQYNKVYDIYPSTKYKAASLRMMGDIYAGELKDYAKADYYYQAVLKNFPGSVERATTYYHLAMLQEAQRDYTACLDSVTKGIEIFLKENQKEDAYEALRYKAEIQKTRVKDYAAAADTLKKTAELYTKDEPKYTDTMLAAADIYGRKLKDPYGQLGAWESIVLTFPASEKAPQALFDAAALAEKLGNTQKAKVSYQKLIVDYAADPLAVKAQRRINAIAAKEAKEEALAADAGVKQVIAPVAATQSAQAAQPAQAVAAQAPQVSSAKTATVIEDDGQEADDAFFDVEDEDIPAKAQPAVKPAPVKKALPAKKAK
jgi:tetratricopeptide (TPR) repeat protein